MRERKRIAVFSAFYVPFVSGAERAVVETVERLVGRFAFTVVTARLDRKLPKRETRLGKDGAAYEVVRLGLGVAADKWLYMLLAPLWALSHQPDAVHAVMESYAGVALWWYKALGGAAKAVLTLQSGDLDMPEKIRRIPASVWRNIHRAPDVVTAISTALADRATRLGAKDVRVIPNGVDLSLASVVKSHVSGVPRHPHRVSIIARLSPEKGLTFLLEAMPLVRARVPDADLIIVGGGPIEASLKAQAASLTLGDTVTFTGALPNDKALEEVAGSGAFVLPSLGEGLGIVLIEAQALGIPVVGTRVGGIPDVIEDGRTGLLVPPRDPKAIADAVLRLFTEQGLAERLAAGAAARLPRFDWDRIVEDYAGLYS